MNAGVLCLPRAVRMGDPAPPDLQRPDLRCQPWDNPGMLIEEKISIGLVGIRIITKDGPQNLITYLRSRNLGVTTVDGTGSSGPVIMVFSIVLREDLPEVITEIRRLHPNGFYSVEEIRSVSEGIFPQKKERIPAVLSRSLHLLRKGK